MLAHYRLKHNSFQIIRIIFIRNKIAVDAQPVHIMVTKHFSFANNRNIVFRMTGYDAGSASYATIHVNTHSPFDAGLIMLRI